MPPHNPPQQESLHRNSQSEAMTASNRRSERSSIVHYPNPIWSPEGPQSGETGSVRLPWNYYQSLMTCPLFLRQVEPSSGASCLECHQVQKSAREEKCNPGGEREGEVLDQIPWRRNVAIPK